MKVIAEPLLYASIIITSKQQARSAYVRLRDIWAGQHPSEMALRVRGLYLSGVVPLDYHSALLAVLPNLECFFSMDWAYLDLVAILQLQSSRTLKCLDVHIDLSQWSCVEALQSIRYLLVLERLTLHVENVTPEAAGNEHLVPLADIPSLSMNRLAGLSLYAGHVDVQTFLSFIARCAFACLRELRLSLNPLTPVDHLAVLDPFFLAHGNLIKLGVCMTGAQLQGLSAFDMPAQTLCLMPGSTMTPEFRLALSVATLELDIDGLQPALPALAVIAGSPEARGRIKRIRFNLSWMDHILYTTEPVNPDGTVKESEKNKATMLGIYALFSQKFARLGIAMVDRDGLGLEKGMYWLPQFGSRSPWGVIIQLLPW
jgi:hypothetical protein